MGTEKFILAPKVREETAEYLLGHEERTRLWLKKAGGEVDRVFRKEDGATLLWLALTGSTSDEGESEEEHRNLGLRVAEVLLKEGSANANAINMKGESLLAHCLEIDHGEAVKLLAVHKLDLDHLYGSDGRHALEYAAERSPDYVVGLLAENAKLCLSATSGPSSRSALHTACFHGRVSVVEILLGHGASLDVKDAAGLRAGDSFSDCVHTHDIRRVKILLSEARRARSLKPRSVAQTGDVDAIQQYAYFGGDMRELQSGTKDFTLMHWACREGSLEFVRALCEQFNFSPHVVAAKDGSTPLHWAARRGEVGIVRYLISQGVDPKVRDGRGRRAGDDFDYRLWAKWAVRDAVKRAIHGPSFPGLE
jgi:ankyrin repeat protein